MTATRVGRLNRSLDLQQPVATASASGAPTLTYVSACSAWAHVEALSGREATTARQLTAEATHRITLQKNPDWTVRPDWQAVDDQGRTFRFLWVGDRDGRDRVLEILAVETIEATSTI